MVNLSARGTSPAFYFNQLKKYNSINKFSKSNNFKNTFLFIMYSNDIVLDKEYCKFYRNIEASYQKFLPEEKILLK